MRRKIFIYNCWKTLFVLLYASTIPLFSLPLNDLIDLALQNNPDILASRSEYESSLLFSKTSDGNFAPGISFSSSSFMEKDFEWNTTPDYFSSGITYSQLIPGGTRFSVTGNYSFDSTDWTTFASRKIPDVL